MLLTRYDHRTHEQPLRLKKLVPHNLKAVRATLLRQAFEPFWKYRSSIGPARFSVSGASRSCGRRSGPTKKVARMLRRHRPLLLNWFRAHGQTSAASVEGLNNKAKLTTRKASMGFALIT